MVEYIPFTPEMLPAAGELLAERHCQDRRAYPALPVRIEDAGIAAAAVEAALSRPQAQGWAAWEGGKLQAYLVGDLQLDGQWGRTGWVRSSGCAIAPGANPELVRDLYARLGAGWVRFGVFAHFALVPISQPQLVQAWFSMSFGIEQVHALLALADRDLPATKPPPGISFRRAVPSDRDTLASFSGIIWREMVEAPCWGIHLPENEPEGRQGWGELAEDPEVTMWLAEMDGEVVAFESYWAADASGENVWLPPDCAKMSIAGTLPAARRRGIAGALTRHGLHAAQEAGYRAVETDWRSANLSADRTWPRLGFQPVIYRLTRRVDQRIAWANAAALPA